PVLVEGNPDWQTRVDIRPPGLVRSEQSFVRSLRSFWQANHQKPAYCDLEVLVLRNLPRAGIGLFSGAGFYPDFILWLRNARTDTVVVGFLDPDGLHHGGLPGAEDKFEALKKLKELSERKAFKDRRIALDGFLLAPPDTPLEKIPGAEGQTWAELEATHPLLY